MGRAIRYYGQLFNKEQNITPEIRKATEAAIAYGTALIKSRSPVKTGALKAGWQGVPKGQGIEWRNSVPYTIYQEMGTRFFPGRHMLESSLPEISAEFKRQLSRNIGKKYGKEDKRSAEQTTKNYRRKGSDRASEMTSGAKFSSPTYDRLIGGSDSGIRFGFR
jgi:hypothetical protein